MPNDEKMPTDPTSHLLLALLGAVVAALVAVTYPAAIPALTLGAAVFVALAALLKL
jgi:hypothetical protein